MSKFILPLVIAALLMSFLRLGFVSLFDVDEAVFSTATREMVHSGDWIMPTYNGEKRYDKPVLFYWLMAASYKTFGINNFAARFPSALAALLLAVALFLFVKRINGEKKAFYAAVSFVLSIYYIIYSHAAVTDMTLTLFISLSLFSFYMSTIHPKNRDSDRFMETKSDKTVAVPIFRARYLYGFYAFSALAFLTKGLIGIVFPFGIAVIYLYASGGWAGLRHIINIKGMVLFLVISAPWYLAQIAINGQEFIDQFFIKHHFMRYAGVISGHSGPLYFYIPALLIGLFPWVAFLPSGIRAVFRDKDRLDLFAFIWAVFIVLFFSLSTTKLPNYILPAVPGIVILIASGMSAGTKKWNHAAYVTMAFLAAILGSGLLLARPYLVRHGIPEDVVPVIAGVLMAGIVLADVYALITDKKMYYVICLITGFFMVVLLVQTLPAANGYLQGALYRYSLYAKDRLQPGEPIIEYGINKPSIVFYSGHRVVNAGRKNDLSAIVDKTRHAIVIAKTKDSGEIESLGFNVVARDAQYALFER
ncbi:MAG: glycosyltransferase family 39 protein [Nitrospirae bacterium]|nr:glycosyltransferase family 39 protein [Nitrospirota bacterium]